MSELMTKCLELLEDTTTLSPRIKKLREQYFETEPLYNGLDEFLQDCNIK